MSTRLFTLKSAVFFVVTGLFLGVSVLFWQSRGVSQEGVLPEKVVIGMREYTLEIADTDTERALGLGGRTELCSSCAMLFLFDTEAQHGFWMADMRFPLDIAWLHNDTIVHIERRIPPESQELYFPPTAANKVLEGNAGSFDGLDRGHRVKFLFPPT